MKKVWLVSFLFSSMVFAFVAACVSQTPVAQSSQAEVSPSRTAPQSVPASPFFTGDGGKGMSLTIFAPEGIGLAPEQASLPLQVQGEMVSNISGYSKIAVTDWENMDSIYAKLLSPYYDDSAEAGADLGHLIPTDYYLNGKIIKTAAGYSLEIRITRTSDKTLIASYSGDCTLAELNNRTGIRRASLDVLQKMGVAINEKTRTELSRAAAASRVSAQTATAQGITAQRSGTVVEALVHYYEAAALDPSLLEAASRASAMSTAITSGNIGENVRNDIQQRGEWVRILTDAANYFKQHPPFEIIYDPNLKQGNINYNNNTVELSVSLVLLPASSGFAVLKDITQGLYKTGKSVTWGLEGWPVAGLGVPAETAIFTAGMPFTITMAVQNQNGKTIGTGMVRLDSGAISARAGILTVPRGARNDIIFRGVKADEITDNLTVSVTGINGINGQTIAERGYISVSALDRLVFSEYVNIWFSGGGWSCRFDNNGIVIVKYEEDAKTITIPSRVQSWYVTHIGDYAFSGKGLTSVKMPDSITSIGKYAFSDNQLISITIPNSVTSIGEGAFSQKEYSNKGLTSLIITDSVITIGKRAFQHNRLTSVTIGRGVTTIGDRAFYMNRLTSIIIPNRVTSIGEEAFFLNMATSITIPASVKSIGKFAFDFRAINEVIIDGNLPHNVYARILSDYESNQNLGFTEAYEKNNKRAGTYTYTGRWFGKLWNFSPR